MNTQAFTQPPAVTKHFKPTPYTRGFEDCRYDREYKNPYPVGSPRWHEYDLGNQDARKAEKEARI